MRAGMCEKQKNPHKVFVWAFSEEVQFAFK